MRLPAHDQAGSQAGRPRSLTGTTFFPGNLLQRLFKMVADEAAGKTKPQAYPPGYVENFVATRTKSAAIFNSCYPSYHFSRWIGQSPCPCNSAVTSRIMLPLPQI